MKSDAGASPYYKLLEQFCYGTLDSYTQLASEQTLPELTAAQTNKLRLLSLLTHAEEPHNLTYKNLLPLLKLNSIAELEELVTNAIYKGLIVARLDPRQQRVNVTSIAPLHDVKPESIDDLISTLNAWSDRCNSTLSDITAQIEEIQSAVLARYKKDAEWNRKIDWKIKSMEEIRPGGDPSTRANARARARERSTGGKKRDYTRSGLFNRTWKKVGLKGKPSGDDDDDVDMDAEDDSSDDMDEDSPEGDELGMPDSCPAHKKR